MFLKANHLLEIRRANKSSDHNFHELQLTRVSVQVLHN